MLAEMCCLALFKWVIRIKVNLLVKTCLRNEKKEYNIKGIYNNDKLKYKDEDALMIIDFKNKRIERENNNYKIIFDFINKISYIEESELKFNLELDVIDVDIKGNYFKVKYKIENDYFELEININKWKLEESYEKRIKTWGYRKFIL